MLLHSVRPHGFTGARKQFMRDGLADALLQGGGHMMAGNNPAAI
jgi:hypothetical protein